MAGSWKHVSVAYILLTATAATYIPWNSRDTAVPGQSAPDRKSNEIPAVIAASNDPADMTSTAPRRHQAFFKDDQDIYRYLKGYGRQLMLWRCRNAIQPSWNRRPLPFIDLFCDVIGTIQTVTWSFKGHDIAGTIGSWRLDGGPRYVQTVATHYDGGRYYSAWLDFRLRIYNVTRRDSGVYRFLVTSPLGDSDQHSVYVDIASSGSGGAKRSRGGSGAVRRQDAGLAVDRALDKIVTARRKLRRKLQRGKAARRKAMRTTVGLLQATTALLPTDEYRVDEGVS